MSSSEVSLEIRVAFFIVQCTAERFNLLTENLITNTNQEALLDELERFISEAQKQGLTNSEFDDIVLRHSARFPEAGGRDTHGVNGQGHSTQVSPDPRNASGNAMQGVPPEYTPARQSNGSIVAHETTLITTSVPPPYAEIHPARQVSAFLDPPPAYPGASLWRESPFEWQVGETWSDDNDEEEWLREWINDYVVRDDNGEDEWLREWINDYLVRYDST